MALAVSVGATTLVAPGCTRARAAGGSRAAPRPAPAPPVSVPPPTTPTTVASTTTSTPSQDVLPAGRPLAGRVVGIDPGHNGRNYTDPAFLNRPVFNGREQETCDTTGTETDAGYTESAFNFAVSSLLAADLTREGARVVLTRSTDAGVGPCITTRASIINDAHADVALDIHADGGPPDGRGFAILEPVADGPNNAVIGASDALALDLRATYARVTGMATSTYDGTAGLAPRNDLAGLNLTTVPKVLIECGNMRNAADAAQLTSPAFQQRVALAMALTVVSFLETSPPSPG